MNISFTKNMMIALCIFFLIIIFYSIFVHKSNHNQITINIRNPSDEDNKHKNEMINAFYIWNNQDNSCSYTINSAKAIQEKEVVHFWDNYGQIIQNNDDKYNFTSGYGKFIIDSNLLNLSDVKIVNEQIDLCAKYLMYNAQDNNLRFQSIVLNINLYE